MSLSAECSPHNTIQGLHLHFSRGDNVICINLMSISEGKKRTADTCGSKLTLFKSPFFPLITDNIGPGLQTKHCYTDNQEV